MSIKIGLLGFGTVASGIPFLLKENGEKVLEASRDQLEIAKVLVKDDEEKIVLSLLETTIILSQMLMKSLTMTRFKSLSN
ncbi:homoserine dehydrogenase [Streptococcus vestibularis F0396]|uniref:Homoserine dehydrogenase n=1 Tax=Streptococcus vestibularis F0396 TaxID=904306 RepID=E3CT99_STRVE|nr:homoserine dehydrogenase [Streptococcus vestibularis F0396]